MTCWSSIFGQVLARCVCHVISFVRLWVIVRSINAHCHANAHPQQLNMGRVHKNSFIVNCTDTPILQKPNFKAQFIAAIYHKGAIIIRLFGLVHIGCIAQGTILVQSRSLKPEKSSDETPYCAPMKLNLRLLLLWRLLLLYIEKS